MNMKEKPTFESPDSGAREENLGRKLSPEEKGELLGEMEEYIHGLESWCEEIREKIDQTTDEAEKEILQNELTEIEEEIRGLKEFAKAGEAEDVFSKPHEPEEEKK